MNYSPERRRKIDPFMEKRDGLVRDYMNGTRTWDQIADSLGQDINMMIAVGDEIRMKTVDKLASDYMDKKETWESIANGLGQDIGMKTAVSTEIHRRLDALKLK